MVELSFIGNRKGLLDYLENERCEVEGVCTECGGIGYVVCDEMNRDGHLERGVGERKCGNPIHEPADFSGATEGDR